MLGHTKAKTLRPEDMLNPALYNNVYNVPSSKVRARPTKPNRKTVLSVGAGGDRTVPKEFAGWDLHTLDIDASSSPDIVADGRDLSVIPDNTYDAIYCSHNIEHYPRHDVTKVLLGFNRVLKPGGVVDIHTPDLGATMERFVKEKLDIDSTLYESPGGPITVKDVIYGYGKQIERSGNDFYAHKGGFTQKSLKRALFRAGFTNIDIATVDLELRAIGHKATAKLAKPKLSKKKQLATKA
jgi:SAM-dependent methyltransferase